MSIAIPNFHLMIQNQFGVNIKGLRFHNAMDYFNQTMSTFLHVSILPKIIECQRGKIGTCLTPPEHFSFKGKFQNTIGEKLP